MEESAEVDRHEMAPAVVDALGLDSPSAVALQGGKVSQVWRAEREGRPVAVRRSPWFRTLDEVRHECELLSTLRGDGAPVAAPVTEPVEVDGSPWVAFEWAQGEHLPRPVEDPQAYGRLLGRLHRHSATAGVTRQRPRWGRVDQFLTTPGAGGTSTLADVLDDFTRKNGPTGDRLRRDVESVHQRLTDARLDGVPQLAVHGDFGPHQVLVDDEVEVATVIDWDFTHLDTALADLAIAASLARPTLDRAVSLIAGYLAEAPDPGDLELLGDLRRAFHLNNLANQVCALWAQGVDISRSLDTIVVRLDRERWWAPVLAEAAQVAREPGVHAAAPTPLLGADASDLDVALDLARRASVVALHHFERGVVAVQKADASPVTEADHAVELLLRHGFGELRPDDAIVGEEMGGTDDPDAGRTWILDPIDGTRSFARGDTDWRVQIALREDDQITVAVVAAPSLGVVWFATAGGGAYEQDLDGDTPPRPLRVSSTPLASAQIVCQPDSLAARLPPELGPASRRGELALIDLVRGGLDAFFVECCEVWDHAPWVLLVAEAGGAFTDHQGGRSPAARGGLYSTVSVHGELLDLLGMTTEP